MDKHGEMLRRCGTKLEIWRRFFRSICRDALGTSQEADPVTPTGYVDDNDARLFAQKEGFIFAENLFPKIGRAKSAEEITAPDGREGGVGCRRRKAGGTVRRIQLGVKERNREGECGGVVHVGIGLKSSEIKWHWKDEEELVIPSGANSSGEVGSGEGWVELCPPSGVESLSN